MKVKMTKQRESDYLNKLTRNVWNDNQKKLKNNCKKSTLSKRKWKRCMANSISYNMNMNNNPKDKAVFIKNEDKNKVNK